MNKLYKYDLLTGNCLKGFLRWYKYSYSLKEDLHEDGKSLNYMPFNMAFTVYVDFFFNQGIVIDLEPFMDYNEDSYTKVLYWRYNIIVMNKDNGSSKEIKTVEKARIKAIKKANKLYNENNNKT